MNPNYSAQDVLRCHLCNTPVPPLHCSTCDINLCKICVGEHHLDESREHKVVPIKQVWSPKPKCKKHSNRPYELFCKHCDIPICVECVFSGEHKGHDFAEVAKELKSKQERLRIDLQELEKEIYPLYEKAASKLKDQKAVLSINFQKLAADLNKQREILHREIDIICQSLQSKINEIESHDISVLDKEEKKINHTLSEISQVILHLRRLTDSNDINLVSEYKSRNASFRSFPLNVEVSLPTLIPGEIKREQLKQQMGSLSTVTRPLLEEALVKAIVNTEYSELLNVSCQNDEEIWLSCSDNVLKLYNLQGKLVKSIKTASGNWPQDIAVKQNGDLVYTDPKDNSINIVKNSQIYLLTRLRGWRPVGVCSTHSGDILVIMVDAGSEQTKVVRYTGSTEKQSIQWDESGQPLFSSGRYDTIKHLTENRNLAICVADYKAHAVVVVGPLGQLCFRYTGSSIANMKSFNPAGICTDSQGRIMTADNANHLIHILDQEGHFLQYIEISCLHRPWGLSLDSRGNLFLAEKVTGKIKKIQYLK